MGLLFSDKGTMNVKARQEDALYQRLGCDICPLRNVSPGRANATGSSHPDILIMGEAPGEKEQLKAEQFIGQSGQLIRPRIPKDWLPHIRWTNTVHCRPPKNRTPERSEVECCRPRWVKDIEETQPLAILGCGNVPLQAITGFTGITMWRGRRMPVKIGSHVCWYYPMLHPSYLLRQRRKEDRDRSGAYVGSEEERMFVFDLNRALQDVSDGLSKPVVHDEKRARAGVEIITAGGREGIAQIRAALEWAKQQPDIGADYETNGLRPYRTGAKILTAAVATMERAVAFPVRHREAEFTPREQETIDDLWCDFLENSGRKWVHHLAFELEWTGRMYSPDLIRASRWEDSATQASVIDERKGKSKPGCFSLEFLVQQYYGFNLKKLSPLDKKNLDGEPLPKVLSYNAMDSKYHFGVGLKQEAIIQQLGMASVYEDALRRVPTVAFSQLRGVPVNQKETTRLHKKYSARVTALEEQIQQVPVVQTFGKDKGEPYSPGSSTQTLEIFHKYLRSQKCVQIDKYTKKVKYSCNEEVLSEIDHPLSPLVVAWRKASRNKSTYLEALMPGTANSALWPDWLLHGIFNTYWAETGRLSSEEPNLQNFPKRDGEAVEVRQQVEAAPGECILSLDLGQIEARVIAMFTKDPVYVKSLWERYDIHMEWTERLARAYPDRIGGRKNLTDKDIMKTFRSDIKNQFTFPLFFGASLKSISGYLHIPEHILAPEYRRFWKQFETTAQWQERQLKFYRKYGYIDCLTGRRRHGPMSLNQVFNSPVQGTAAEMIMDRMCAMSETGDPELQPELQIHDDLTFLRVKESRADIVAEKILDIMLDMSRYDWINVPISVELSHGYNWAPYNKKTKTNPRGLSEIGTFWSDTWLGDK